jgi:hypothetical protein
MANKSRAGWLMAVAIVISGAVAFVPTMVSATGTSPRQAKEVAASGFGAIWSALSLPGRWAVASLHVQGVGFGADTLLFVGVMVAVYYFAFWLVRQMWTARTISNSRPKNYSPMYDDDPEFEPSNAFRRVEPVMPRKHSSFASSRGISIPSAHI